MRLRFPVSSRDVLQKMVSHLQQEYWWMLIRLWKGESLRRGLQLDWSWVAKLVVGSGQDTNSSCHLVVTTPPPTGARLPSLDCTGVA